MQQVLWILFDLLINLFQCGMFAGFVFVILDCKAPVQRQKWIFIIPTLLMFGVLTTFNSITVFEGLGIFCYSAIIFVQAMCFFHGSCFKKLLLSLLPNICIAISNAISINIIALLSHQNPVEFLSDRNLLYVSAVAIANILFVWLWLILKTFFKHHDVTLTKTEWVLICIVLTISVFIFVQLYFIGVYSTEDSVRIYVALATVLLIAMNVIVYALLMQLSKKHAVMMENTLLRQQYEFQEKSATDIKRQYDNLQKMRHDYKNTLLVIQSLNAGGKQQEIESFIAEYLSETDITPTIITTDNEYVNAIVNLKIAEARDAGITVTVDLPSKIGFPHYIDLCNLLGNLFDNALEACTRCPEQNRSIHLSFTQENEQFVLFMKNTVTESVLKNNPYLITRKKNKTQHGYGTKIIRETAQKHHGFADFYEDGGFFCCNVVMYGTA